MATKKQKRERMQAKHEAFMQKHKEAGLKALQADQEARKDRRTQADLELSKRNQQRSTRHVDYLVAFLVASNLKHYYQFER